MIPIASPLSTHPRRPARFVVQGNFDGARSATVTIDRARGLVSVRPFRSRREYDYPLADFAEWVVWRCIKLEVQAAAKGRR